MVNLKDISEERNTKEMEKPSQLQSKRYHRHESAMGVLVLPILNPPPPPSPSHPSGSSQCTSPEHPVSCIEPGLVIYFTYGNIHVSVLFSQIIPPLSSPTESKSLLFTSVPLFAVSHIGSSSLPSF